MPPVLVSTAAPLSGQTALTTDAVILALMQTHGLTHLASHDAHFDGVSAITRYALSNHTVQGSQDWGTGAVPGRWGLAWRSGAQPAASVRPPGLPSSGSIEPLFVLRALRQRFAKVTPQLDQSPRLSPRVAGQGAPTSRGSRRGRGPWKKI